MNASSHRLLRISRLLSYDWNEPHWRILYLHDVPREKLDAFRRLVDYFSTGFKWISLQSGVQAIRDGTVAQLSMTLTFDDAHRSVFEVVFPVLRELQIPACVYVVPLYVEKGFSTQGRTGQPIMTWSQLAAWCEAGYEVGSHSYTHVPLPQCSSARLSEELIRSKDVLQTRLGCPVLHFAYPFGQYTAVTQQVLRKLGCYQTVATTDRGGIYRGHDPLALRRNRVNLEQSPQENELLMRLADRFYWIRMLQRSWRAALRRSARTPLERFEPNSQSPR